MSKILFNKNNTIEKLFNYSVKKFALNSFLEYPGGKNRNYKLCEGM